MVHATPDPQHSPKQSVTHKNADTSYLYSILKLS
jgi:hypothetical protein